MHILLYVFKGEVNLFRGQMNIDKPFGLQAFHLNYSIYIMLTDLLAYIFLSVYLQSRTTGSRLNIVIVAEGAIDRNGRPISTTYIKDVSL